MNALIFFVVGACWEIFGGILFKKNYESKNYPNTPKFFIIIIFLPIIFIYQWSKHFLLLLIGKRKRKTNIIKREIIKVL